MIPVVGYLLNCMDAKMKLSNDIRFRYLLNYTGTKQSLFVDVLIFSFRYLLNCTGTKCRDYKNMDKNLKRIN